MAKDEKILSIRKKSEWFEALAQQLKTPILPENLSPEELEEKHKKIEKQRIDCAKSARVLTALLRLKKKL
jgi:hypothetical protein